MTQGWVFASHQQLSSYIAAEKLAWLLIKHIVLRHHTQYLIEWVQACFTYTCLLCKLQRNSTSVVVGSQADQDN